MKSGEDPTAGNNVFIQCRGAVHIIKIRFLILLPHG